MAESLPCNHSLKTSQAMACGVFFSGQSVRAKCKKNQFSMLNEIHRIASLHIRLFIVPNQYLYALLCHVFNIKNLIDLRALHTIEKEVSV
jgi:hypothetical protein